VGVILTVLVASLPLTTAFAFGTTAVLLLDAVTVKLLAAVSGSLTEKSIPSVLTGSVGSLITPLAMNGLGGDVTTPPSMKLLVVATSREIAGGLFGRSLSVIVILCDVLIPKVIPEEGLLMVRIAVSVPS
jgi:hypothetical protein